MSASGWVIFRRDHRNGQAGKKGGLFALGADWKVAPPQTWPQDIRVHTLTELEHLLGFLDDPDPGAADALELALLDYEGDISEVLTENGRKLSPPENAKLSQLLRLGREIRAREDWFVPGPGLDEDHGDLETFEALLRVVSDFLHDGVTLRPTLSDLLDGVAAKLEDEDLNSESLANRLFQFGWFRVSPEGPDDPADFDLANVLKTNRGAGPSLLFIYQLVAARLNVVIGPGEDPFNLIWRHFRASRPGSIKASAKSLAKSGLDGQLTPRLFLSLYLARLERALKNSRRPREASVIAEMASSLKAVPTP